MLDYKCCLYVKMSVVWCKVQYTWKEMYYHSCECKHITRSVYILYLKHELR
jgi:hypothetical protein